MVSWGMREAPTIHFIGTPKMTVTNVEKRRYGAEESNYATPYRF